MNKVKLARDVINALRGLADSYEAFIGALEETQAEPVEQAAKEKDKPKVEASEPEEPKTEQEQKKESTPRLKKPTLEELRAVMAEKNKEGHREAVKAIIIKYGVTRLTELDSRHYAKVMKEVREIQ